MPVPGSRSRSHGAATILDSPTRDGSLVRNTLDKLAVICLFRSRRILLIGALLGIAALVAASHLRFDPELLNLVPEHNVEINEFRQILEEMGTIDYHIVVVKIPEGRSWEDYTALLDRFGRQYEALPLVEQVDYSIPEPLSIVDSILPHSMLLLTAAEVEQVGDRLTDDAIREVVARNHALLRTPQAVAMKGIVQYDPFNLLPIFLGKFHDGEGGFRFDASSGYYLSADHSTLLILTKPRRPAQDIAFSREMMQRSAEIEERVIKAFREESPGVPIPEIAYTGGYAIAHDDAALIKKDVIVNVLFSFFGVIALFIYAFRRVAAIGYAGIPMGLGIALTFGLAGLTYGVLSSASAGFAALLAGLGIDFITVLYERYVEERNADSDVAEALRTTMRSTMPGVIIAAMTTAATFYGFLATDFRGMTQLGFLTGTGILLFLVSVAFLLPALIVESEKRATKVPKLYLHTFGSDHLIRFSLERPWQTIAIWSAFLIAAAIASLNLQFSDNIQNLRARGNRGVIVQEYLTDKFGQSFDYMMLVVHGKTQAQTIERTAAITPELDRLVKDDVIATYQAITQFVPPKSQQEKVIEILEKGRGDRFSPARIRATFESALEAEGFREDSYADFIERFERALTPGGPISPDDIDDETLRRLMQRFMQPTRTDGYLSVVYLYPAKGVWDREVPEPLMRLARGQADLTLTGVNLVSGVLRRIVRADAVRSTLLGFALVFLLLAVFFRSAKQAALIFVPFLAGCLGMLGVMAAFGVQFNFMNVFVGLMLVGVGTDYGIYMLQRHRENPAEFHIHGPDTGKAVVMAALTSIVGYGSFALSHYPGLRSIGYASTLGIGLSGLAAITLLPALLVIQKHHKEAIALAEAQRASEGHDKPASTD